MRRYVVVLEWVSERSVESGERAGSVDVGGLKLEIVFCCRACRRGDGRWTSRGG